jgi:hypothetical protein
MFTASSGEEMALEAFPFLTVSYYVIELRFRGLGF